jgi:pimeloyl-ACP methyl ester carboxylesterase
MTATRIPLLLLFLLLILLLPWQIVHSAESAAPPLGTGPGSSPPPIVIGFVGGFVHHDNARRSEIQLAEKLRAEYTDQVRVEVFQNRRWKMAARVIRQWLDANHDGKLSDAEKRNARIVLYGHSWGGAAVVSLARQLDEEGIPVLLTVQVDSIAKPGQDDRVIPVNVEKAANFYQARGLLHGCPKIAAADPAHTQILGDFRFTYEKAASACAAYPWYDRLLFPGHTAIGCDPGVWSQVRNLISTQLVAAPEQVPYSTAKNQAANGAETGRR